MVMDFEGKYVSQDTDGKDAGWGNQGVVYLNVSGHDVQSGALSSLPDS